MSDKSVQPTENYVDVFTNSVNSTYNRTNLLFDEETPKPIQRLGKIHIGTSGYSFNDWQGPFYPKGLPRGKWLDYYAQHFSAVEINATYYRTPPLATFQSMVDRTPDDFEFWVKVPGLATHTNDDFSQSVQQFIEAIKPLSDAGKLKGVLAQFPPYFRRSVKSQDKLACLKDSIGETRLAVEFRHKDWLVDETYVFLTDHRIMYVVVDLPDLPDLPGSEIHKSDAVSYVRFHGRNSRTWNNTELGDRYDYDYSTDELTKWLPRIAELDAEGSTAYLFFNNCHAGQAVKNAKMLRQMLELEINMSSEA
ncbi:MAG: DUF72 domain-containing protein [Candidatus Hatepunaea meridiana]|nr:DUF72 domain-containing protein [Candidatus Hatepunaea meridiana]